MNFADWLARKFEQRASGTHFCEVCQEQAGELLHIRYRYLPTPFNVEVGVVGMEFDILVCAVCLEGHPDDMEILETERAE